jgi:hypothetical protein
MIKTMRLVRKPAGAPADEFRWNWLLTHGSAVREAIAQSPIDHATASFAAPVQITNYGEGHQVPVEQDFDAIESLYFPSLPHLRAALDSGVLATLAASLDAVTDGGGSVPCAVTLEETMQRRPDTDAVLGDGPRQKLARTLVRKEGTDLYQFRDHWHNHHRVIETGGGWLGKSPLTNVSFSIGQVLDGSELRPTADGDGLMSLDGVIEIFSSPDVDVANSYGFKFPAEVRRDELNFLSMDAPIRRVIMLEHVIG